MLFPEEAVYAKQHPNEKGAEKPKNEADESSLLVKSVLLGEFTHKNVALDSCKTDRPPHQLLPDHREREYTLCARQLRATFQNRQEC